MSEVRIRPDKIEVGKGASKRCIKAGKDGYIHFTDKDGVTEERIGQVRRYKGIKKDKSGAVQFAGTGTDRGTVKTLTANTPTTQFSFDGQPANFAKLVMKIGTTGSPTAGKYALKLMQGTSVIGSVTTTAPVAGTNTTTLENFVATTPKVVLSNPTAIAGGTVTGVTVTAQLNDLVTVLHPHIN